VTLNRRSPVPGATSTAPSESTPDTPAAENSAAPARFYGLALATADIDATAGSLGPLLGEVRDAVQPGRRIATVRRHAQLGLPVAFMSV